MTAPQRADELSRLAHRDDALEELLARDTEMLAHAPALLAEIGATIRKEGSKNG